MSENINKNKKILKKYCPSGFYVDEYDPVGIVLRDCKTRRGICRLHSWGDFPEYLDLDENNEIGAFTKDNIRTVLRSKLKEVEPIHYEEELIKLNKRIKELRNKQKINAIEEIFKKPKIPKNDIVK